jgi:hypothetical protein
MKKPENREKTLTNEHCGFFCIKLFKEILKFAEEKCDSSGICTVSKLMLY